MTRRANTPRAASLLVAVLACAPLACGTPPSEAECGAMLDHYVTMKAAADANLAAVSEAERQGAVHEAVTKMKASSVYRARLTQCQREVSRRAFDCAMKTDNPDRWEGCL